MTQRQSTSVGQWSLWTKAEKESDLPGCVSQVALTTSVHGGTTRAPGACCTLAEYDQRTPKRHPVCHVLQWSQLQFGITGF